MVTYAVSSLWSSVSQLPLGCAMTMRTFAPPAAAFPDSTLEMSPVFDVNASDGAASDTATILGIPDPLDALKLACANMFVQPMVLSAASIDEYMELTETIATSSGSQPMNTLDMPPIFWPAEGNISSLKATYQGQRSRIAPSWEGQTIKLQLRLQVPPLNDGGAFFIFKIFCILPSGHTVLFGVTICRMLVQNPVAVEALPVAYYPQSQRTPDRVSILAFISVSCDSKLDCRRVALFDLRVEGCTLCEDASPTATEGDTGDPRLLVSHNRCKDYDLSKASIQFRSLGEHFPISLKPGEVCVVPVELHMSKVANAPQNVFSPVTPGFATPPPQPAAGHVRHYSVAAVACFTVEGFGEELMKSVLIRWQNPPPSS